MVTGLDQSPAGFPPTSNAGCWPAADAATLAAGPFFTSWLDFAPAFAASLVNLWFTSWLDFIWSDIG